MGSKTTVGGMEPPVNNEPPITTHIEHKEPGKGADEALAYVSERGPIEWTDEEEKRLVRKLDLWIIPVLFFVNLFGLFDSQAFSIAALFGMVEDLGLYEILSISPLTLGLNRYSWASSIVYFGGLISLYPLLYIAQRFSLGKVTTGLVAWSGFFSLMMLVVKNFPETMVVRFLYGFQGANIALCTLVTSTWYKTNEQPLRIALWNSGSTTGSVIGQAIDVGPVVYGIIATFILADNPLQARWLKPRERDIAVMRLRANGTGIHSRVFKLDHVKEALLDPQLYALSVAAFGIAFCNAAFGSFGALIVQSIPGLSEKRALVLLIPASAIAVTVIMLSGVLSTIYPKLRVIIGLCFIPPSIAGNVLLWKSNRDNLPSLLGGLYTCVFFYGFFVQWNGLISSNIGGNTKRSIVNATIAILSSVGAIAAPFSFKGSESAQGYPTGIKALLSLQGAMGAAFIFLSFYYVNHNRNKDRKMADMSVVSETESAFSDLTEKQNPYFRYSL
ncbi:uncharacterized transporter C757.13 [Aspergillus awamori]|uniref:Uncharacterized transporter C757.13 n=1 Tax=Aspergillus awamori TaxID=105351 RepID=A0A401KNA6_ASPAW|nr:uncharacterized transporter C757.13 [Aspergillus awamori]